MKLRDLSMVTTLMSLTLLTSMAKPLPTRLSRSEFADDALRAATRARTTLPQPPEVLAKDKVLESVYYDIMAILSTTNRCSDYFNGSAVAMEVFNQFVGQARKDILSASVAMRMQGPTTSGADARTNARYRLFNKVSINANGAFYKNSHFSSEQRIPGVGSFRPNTREVRVLILLHELGHLMQGVDGKWLLPDDGGDEFLSRSNSHKIEQVCAEQINGLSNGEVLRNLAMSEPTDDGLAANKD
jgi:hypothetical protein